MAGGGYGQPSTTVVVQPSNPVVVAGGGGYYGGYGRGGYSGGDLALGMLAGAAIGTSLGYAWGGHHGKLFVMK